MKRACEVCSAPISHLRRHAKVCSATCRSRKSRGEAAPSVPRCRHCDRPVTGRRSDARYCDDLCRSRFRARNRAEAGVEGFRCDRKWGSGGVTELRRAGRTRARLPKLDVEPPRLVKVMARIALGHRPRDRDQRRAVEHGFAIVSLDSEVAVVARRQSRSAGYTHLTAGCRRSHNDPCAPTLANTRSGIMQGRGRATP